MLRTRCEHSFVTSQGTAQGRVQRAIDAGNLWAAEAAARELGRLPLGSALALTALIADVAPQRFERAAVRWHGRFVLEVPGLTIAESQLALGAVASLRGGDRSTAVWVLGELGGAHGAPNVTLGVRPGRV
jgi:hypothetical protein